MNRRSFVKSVTLMPLAAGQLAVAATEPAPAKSQSHLNVAEVGSLPASSRPLRSRYGLTLQRVLAGESPAYSEEFLLADVRPTAARRFTEYSGDVSGRYIGALATAARVYQQDFPNLDSLVAKVVALQKPEGYFGRSFDVLHPGDLDMALLWGNGRLLVGLLEYYRYKPEPAVLAACVRLGDFLLRIAPLMLSKEIRDSFGAQHFASSYICWTQQTEGLANLYMVTNDSRYRQLAEQIAAVTERRPSDHVHGYLTSLRGWVDLLRVTRDQALLSKCEAAWDEVVQSNDLLITGGVPEGWTPNNHRTEGCAEVDWLRLNLALAEATGKARYLDMAERTAFNEFSFNQFATGDFGHRVYSETGLPAAGAVRAWWCCTLHGLRCFPDLHDSVFRPGDHRLDYNLPLDARISSDSLSAVSTSTLTHDGKSRIVITAAPSKAPVSLNIRQPAWARTLTVLVNGNRQSALSANGYATITRAWKSNDVVEIHYGMELRTQSEANNRQSYWFGPWLLGASAAANPVYFNELTLDNRLAGHPAAAQAANSPNHFAVPVATHTVQYIPAEFSAWPGTVILQPIAEQAGEPVTSWELRFLTAPSTRKDNS